ncbi:hypothetical protein AN958_10790 [Leucoagaricus sp. SymC.cos]|nr:hypothetical protein AN958_10790 [Leucoagaricus sp. SymC.cos]
MKFSLLAAVVAGATLAQVGASPLRVVVVSSSIQEMPNVQHLRYGHALADSPVAKLSVGPQPPVHVPAQFGGRRPCGKRIKDKAIQISNAFRHALGLPPILTSTKPGEDVHGGMVHISPFIGTPGPTFIKPNEYHINGVQQNTQEDKPYLHPHPHRHFHHHAQHIRKWGNTFMMRIHNALMALGPWEGRAVAFVLGCGIGVLLRMFWVLTVIAYRSTCGARDDEYTQVAVIEEYIDAEEIAVPPPTYTTVDEKEQIKVKDAAEN